MSFWLGRFRIRISLSVLVVAALILLRPGLRSWLGAGRVVAFVLAVMAHELGHAAAARSFGLQAELDLTFSGSLRSWLASLSTGRRIAVCAAGPAANLCLAALTFALLRQHGVEQAPGSGSRYFAFVNLGWGLLNLIPVFPLDGGYALAAALDRAIRGHGERTVRWLSILSATVIGAAALASRMVIPVLFCGLIAGQSAWALRVDRDRAVARRRLQIAYEALERGEAATAKHHCLVLLSFGAGRHVRKDAVRLLAYAYATSDEWVHLLALLEEGAAALLPEEELNTYERAATELGRAAEARRIAALRGRLA